MNKEQKNPIFTLSVDPSSMYEFIIYIHDKFNFITLFILTCRSTPVETLHTILLGPCKYLLKTIMSNLTASAAEARGPCQNADVFYRP